jgi:hypothetical protein
MSLLFPYLSLYLVHMLMVSMLTVIVHACIMCLACLDMVTHLGHGNGFIPLNWAL